MHIPTAGKHVGSAPTGVLDFKPWSFLFAALNRVIVSPAELQVGRVFSRLQIRVAPKVLVEVVGLQGLCAFDLDSKGGTLGGTWCLPSCYHCSGHA